MSGLPTIRGRGRGRGGRSSTTPDQPQASTSNLSNASASAGGSTSAPGVGGVGGGVGGSFRRPVGGLLGGSEYLKRASSVTGGGTKFKPNMVRKTRIPDPNDDDDDDDDMADVKMEDNSFSTASRGGRGRGRGGVAARGRGRGRVEIEMTASGPMAQGPGGIPKTAGRSIYGGAGVMNAAIKVGSASRSGGSGGGGGGGAGSNRVRNKALANGQFDDASDPDDSDYDDSDHDGERAELLDDIGLEDEMAPMNLPKDPKVSRLAKERKIERTVARVKREAPVVKPEPDDDMDSVIASSTRGTPALNQESRANTVDSKDTLVQLEDVKEFKPDIDMKEDFDVENPGIERLYIFQFPRKFPDLVNVNDVEALTPKFAADGTEIKPEPVDGAPAAPRKRTPPEWGRTGARAEMASRWPTTEGRMGTLRVHRSGKISLKVNGDLVYDVLPAAQPTFLQEIAILDHDPSTSPPQKDERPAKSEPDRSLKIMGQTFKKFIVVPEVSHLLSKIGEQQEREAKELARRKALKKEKK